jgi:ABC-2 type transport system ATP-binding protein
LPDQIIEIENLTKIFDKKLIAVNNVSLNVEKGAIAGFLGQNGAGKTTTIRLLLGLLRPSAGEVRVFGEKMTCDSASLRRRIGYLPTNPKFPPKMTAIEYLDYVGKLFSLKKEERIGRLSNLIRAVGLLPSASREIKGFSTGMVTRLGIAAALMNDPELLLLDEPTSGLDPAGRKSTLELISEMGKRKTVFVSSHILGDIDRICTHASVIDEGKVVFSGSIKEMKKKTQSGVLRLELDGDLDSFCEGLKTIGGIASFTKRGDLGVDLILDSNVSILDVLKEVVALLSNHKLELISITSSSSSIEDAFLEILKAEDSRGFLRAETT